MKVGIYTLEKYVNCAAMQVSQYHKQRGDTVEMYSPLCRTDYDRIYAFSLFDFTPKHYVTSEMICGGTGFDTMSRLPPEIEACEYDYSLYPDCDHSIIWFSRGCPRKCSFCVVPKKEGYIQPVKPNPLNPNGKYVKVFDNNFFANPEWEKSVEQLKAWGQPVEMTQGIDMRTLTKPQAEALLSFKHTGQIHFAWDDPDYDMVYRLKEVTQWIRPYRLMCYVLIGFNSTPKQDLDRVMALRDLGVDPFAMPFDRKVKYQRDFTRWVNHKAIFKSITFDMYKDDQSWKNFQAKKHSKVVERKERALV